MIFENVYDEYGRFVKLKVHQERNFFLPEGMPKQFDNYILTYFPTREFMKTKSEEPMGLEKSLQ